MKRAWYPKMPIETRRVALGLLAVGMGLWAGLMPPAACAKEPKVVAKTAKLQPAASKPHVVALVSLESDERYANRRLEKAYPTQPAGRLLPAAQLAVADTEMALTEDKLALQVRDVRVATEADLAPTLRKLKAEGVTRWLLDLPADAVEQAVRAGGDEVLMFNVSAESDALRGSRCAPQLFHTHPSQAMLADALAQYLAARSWRQALVLQGTTGADVALGDAWARSAKRYGIKTTVKPFKLSGDPRERDLSNPRLLTGDRNHDVVVVLDADGEFARTLPYATQQPRPVVGSNGLMALGWHPHWERNGGPQVSRRFRRLTDRPMVGQDWSAWMAVRTVAALLQAQPTATAAEQARQLRSGQVGVDGSKGPALTYRQWDGQLRQPVFLAHADGVVATAPLEGVLHPTDVLDTLGHDAPESLCKNRP